MAHKGQTRRMANAGKKTGVSSRRSLKPRGAFGKAISGDGSNDPRTGHPKAVQAVEQFWNDLSHQWFGTNTKSFPYNMSKWAQGHPKEQSPRPKFIQGGWPEYAEWAEAQDQRDKHAWPSRNDQALLPNEEPKESMGDGGWVWPKYARAQDRVIKGHRGRDIKRYAKSLVTKQSHR